MANRSATKLTSPREAAATAVAAMMQLLRSVLRPSCANASGALECVKCTLDAPSHKHTAKAVTVRRPQALALLQSVSCTQLAARRANPVARRARRKCPSIDFGPRRGRALRENGVPRRRRAGRPRQQRAPTPHAAAQASGACAGRCGVPGAHTHMMPTEPLLTSSEVESAGLQRNKNPHLTYVICS